MTRSAWILALFIAIGVAAAGLALWRAEGDAPAVEAPGELFVGRDARSLAVEVRDVGSGLRSASATLIHAGGEVPLLERRFAGGLLMGGGPTSESVEVVVDPKALHLRDGSALLQLDVRDWSWRGTTRGNRSVVQIPVEIDTERPKLSVDSGLTYVRRGGAAAATYVLSEAGESDGVKVGERLYPGISWPREDVLCRDFGARGSACRLALFAVPIDADADLEIAAIASDRAGNDGTGRWDVRVQEREIPRVPIQLTDRFLEGKVRDLAEAWDIDASDPVAAFDRINTRRRARDEARIRELVADAQDEPLWKGAFEQLENSKVTSLFAERRLYQHGGKVVSEATHYGYDLASTAGAPVTASNAGRVLYAGELGIYGDTVLLDHGMGIVSLYGHLSSIDVAKGDAVEQGGVLGRTGQTGLAGGDHLHFAILVSGTYVDPREWWDPKWVREHVDVRMGR